MYRRGGRSYTWSKPIGDGGGISPIAVHTMHVLVFSVGIQSEYIEAQSIECRHAESADIMDSWDWRTLGSWIWRTLLSPHRLAVRSTEHPPMVTERLTDADGRGRRKGEGGKRKRDACFSVFYFLFVCSFF